MRPDSRASWAVAAACCFINCLLYGVARLSGILMVASVHTFQVSRARAALPFALSTSLRNLSGVFVGHLGQRWGVRVVVCSGTVLASLGAGLCFFAQDIFWITVCWGGLFGIGYGLATCLLPLAINQHFVKHCGTASGISYSGSYIGSFIFPPLVVILLSNYGLPGTFLIISGTVLNVLAASMFLEDPSDRKTASDSRDSWWQRLRLKYAAIRTHQMKTPTVAPPICLTSSVTLQEDSNHHDSYVTGFRGKSDSVPSTDATLPNHVPKSRLSTVSKNSLSKGKSKSKYIAKLTKLKQMVSVSLFRQKYALKLDLPSIQNDNIKLVAFRNLHCILCPCVPHSQHYSNLNATLNNNHENFEGTKNQLLDFYGNPVRLIGDHRQNLKAISGKPDSYLKNIKSMKVLDGINMAENVASHRTCGVRNGGCGRNSSVLPVSNQSSGRYPSAKLFMDYKPCEPLSLSASAKLFSDRNHCHTSNLCKSVSLFSDHQHCQTSNLSTKLFSDDKPFQTSSLSTSTKLLMDRKQRCGSKRGHPLVRKTRSFCLEWMRLLGMPMFIVISLTMSLYTFVMVCLITIIEDFAKDLQIPESDVHYVLMVLSIADLVGTLTLGVITDRGYMSRRHFIALCFLGMGVCSASLSLVTGSTSLLCCVVCYGMFESGTVITFPVLMGEFVPPGGQAVAIASSNVLSAPVVLLVPLVIGHFRDHIGCYSGVFYLLGVTSMLCASLWLMVPLIHRAWRKEFPRRPSVLPRRNALTDERKISLPPGAKKTAM
ncbi:uncharacterized protein LOC129217675 [Uloborus diversus]|uniref:uncharacterized protein LOC129217675 n=1 Tax=Uloborus diversus TaxID=327109 RepID=UPI00240A42DA|nr:uncharacterized protein LOC129217675 [Uloborus diversus]XP_054707981.1 uncharacterized protein LOC129217675 [Uloborus diversus]XP_054707982.1 uncharacterized protein LOC129217675 [Uloborus diversus]